MCLLRPSTHLVTSLRKPTREAVGVQAMHRFHKFEQLLYEQFSLSSNMSAGCFLHESVPCKLILWRCHHHSVQTNMYYSCRKPWLLVFFPCTSDIPFFLVVLFYIFSPRINTNQGNRTHSAYITTLSLPTTHPHYLGSYEQLNSFFTQGPCVLAICLHERLNPPCSKVLIKINRGLGAIYLYPKLHTYHRNNSLHTSQ
jgi:hypothetical protein